VTAGIAIGRYIIIGKQKRRRRGVTLNEGSSKMLEINCLVCGQTIKIPEFIDTNNYDGQVSCPQCKSLLHIKLVGAKVRKYMVVERKPTGSDLTWADITKMAGDAEKQQEKAAVDVKSVAKYNSLRDFLATYRATQLQLAFEQIEGIIGSKLETGAYTFKSWWENDRGNPQAIAWLEAGWEIVDVILEQRKVILRRVK
jgi:uncharacterized Zn finger protein (UPF0148 family)